MRISERVALIQADEETDILTALCDYADMGYSRSFVARMWGFNASHFRKKVLHIIDPSQKAKWRPRNDTVDWRESRKGIISNPEGPKPKRINVGDQEMTYADLAKATGLSISGARSRYKRGRFLTMRKLSREQVARLGGQANRQRE